MNHGTKIEWTHAPGYKGETWNPVRGCTRVSEGCRNCYAEIMAARFSEPGMWGHGFAEMRGGDHRWTGRVELVESQLDLPLRWRAPRCIFVNSTSDMFHEYVHDEMIDMVFGIMALCPQHIFIILTKRQKRMRAWLTFDRIEAVHRQAEDAMTHREQIEPNWPLPNVILGVSVEDQATADERIPHLLATPAAVRFVSAEPLLGPVDFVRWLPICRVTTCYPDREKAVELKPSKKDGPHLNWIVAGGESGPGARPMHPDWARLIRDQCQEAGAAFFMKQMTKKAPIPDDLMVREFPAAMERKTR